MAYANGQIPTTVLSVVPGQAGLYFTPAAARSWGKVVAEVQRRYGWSPWLTDAYRSLYGYYGQIETFLRRYSRTYVEYSPGKVDRRVWNGVPYWRVPGTAAAAVPGTSNHGWALAGDVTGLGGFGTLRYNQFSDVATEYGWSNDEGRRVNEPWHWVNAGAILVTNPGEGTVDVPDVPDVDPIDPIKKKDDDDVKRFLARTTGTDAYMIHDAIHGRVVNSWAEVQSMIDSGIEFDRGPDDKVVVKWISPSEFDTMRFR